MTSLAGRTREADNVSLTVRDKATRQSPQTTTFEEEGEQKRVRAEVPLLTRLKPFLNWANVSSRP